MCTKPCWGVPGGSGVDALASAGSRCLCCRARGACSVRTLHAFISQVTAFLPCQGKAAGKKPCPQICPFNLACKGDKFHIDMAAAAELPAGSPELPSRSQPGGPLEEIHLGAAAQKTPPGTSLPNGKGTRSCAEKPCWCSPSLCQQGAPGSFPDVCLLL